MRATLIATALPLFGCATGPRPPLVVMTPVELRGGPSCCDAVALHVVSARFR
ncbi:MAG TPA: hypothetical protein VF603_04250 [Allosphingosinicella sp.]